MQLKSGINLKYFRRIAKAFSLILGFSFLQNASAFADDSVSSFENDDCAKISEYDADNRVDLIVWCVETLAESTLISSPRSVEWHSLTVNELSSGWTRYSPYEPFRYGYDKEKKIVYLDGMMSGCPDPSGAIFTLPEGMRPANRLIFDTQANSDTARVDIHSNGIVQYHWSAVFGQVAADCDSLSTPQKWLSISGVSFPVTK
ncbi:MAG: hypothetical protein ACFB2Z_11540 [Maricaulaceae bacterium]